MNRKLKLRLLNILIKKLGKSLNKL